MITTSKNYSHGTWEKLAEMPAIPMVRAGGVISDDRHNECWYQEVNGTRHFKLTVGTGEWCERILHFTDIPVLPGNEVEYLPGTGIEYRSMYEPKGRWMPTRVIRDDREDGIVIATGGQLYRHLHYIRLAGETK